MKDAAEDTAHGECGPAWLIEGLRYALRILLLLANGATILEYWLEVFLLSGFAIICLSSLSSLSRNSNLLMAFESTLVDAICPEKNG